MEKARRQKEDAGEEKELERDSAKGVTDDTTKYSGTVTVKRQGLSGHRYD